MLSETEKQLRDELRKLEKENINLKKEVDRLRRVEDEKKRIEREYEDLKAKHAATVFNLQKALKIKADKITKRKPLGAPKNHKGHARHNPDRIDSVRKLTLKRCPDCNTMLKGKTQEVRSRHVIDIKPAARPKNTRYDIHRKYCPKCKKLVEPKVPNVLPHARFGLNLMLLVMYLRLGLRLPGNKVCDYFMDMFNLKISDGEIPVILRQLETAFGGYYSHLKKLVKLARVKYSDTTSWKINGKNYYAWVFIAYGVVLYKIQKRNNHKVALALLGKKQKNNVLVVDRFSAFRTLAEKTGFLLQLCWSHILQDSKGLARDFGKEGKYVHEKLKEIYKLAASLDHKGAPEMVEQLKGEIFQLTQRHYKHLTVWKFVKTLYDRDVDNLFRFVTDPDIDPTNNISERELRALVIIRKISYGSRSIKGADITASLLSVIQTLRLNKKNVLKGLLDILNNPSGY